MGGNRITSSNEYNKNIYKLEKIKKNEEIKVQGKKKGGNFSTVIKTCKVAFSIFATSLLVGTVIGTGAGAGIGLITGGAAIPVVPLGTAAGAMIGSAIGVLGVISYLFIKAVKGIYSHIKKEPGELVENLNKDKNRLPPKELPLIMEREYEGPNGGKFNPKKPILEGLKDEEIKDHFNIPISSDGIQYTKQSVRDFASGSIWIVNQIKIDIETDDEGNKIDTGETDLKLNSQIHQMDKHLHQGLELNQQQITNLLSITHQGILSNQSMYFHEKMSIKGFSSNNILHHPELITEYHIEELNGGLIKIDIYACIAGKDLDYNGEVHSDDSYIRTINYVRKSITISKEDLNKNWIDEEDVPLSLTAIDYYSPTYQIPEPEKNSNAEELHEKINVIGREARSLISFY